jgi:hypothetical protein
MCSGRLAVPAPSTVSELLCTCIYLMTAWAHCLRICLFWLELRFPLKNYVRYVFTSICFVRISFFINVTCIYLRNLVSNSISISVDVVVWQEHYGWHGCLSPEHFSSFRDFCGLCKSLFVLLSFFIWSWSFLAFDLRLLNSPLVSSTFSQPTVSEFVYVLYKSLD